MRTLALCLLLLATGCARDLPPKAAKPPAPTFFIADGVARGDTITIKPIDTRSGCWEFVKVNEWGYAEYVYRESPIPASTERVITLSAEGGP